MICNFLPDSFASRTFPHDVDKKICDMHMLVFGVEMVVENSG